MPALGPQPYLTDERNNLSKPLEICPHCCAELVYYRPACPNCRNMISGRDRITALDALSLILWLLCGVIGACIILSVVVLGLAYIGQFGQLDITGLFLIFGVAVLIFELKRFRQT